MEGDIGNGKCINLVKVDADAVAVTPSSKQQELHTSERTIVSQTVIFVIVFVVVQCSMFNSGSFRGCS